MIFLSIDFGTSAVKMSIIDDKLNTLCWSKCDYHYLILPGEKNELKESDLFHALYQAAGSLDKDLLSKVEMLVFCTFSPSPVFMDEEGELVYPNIITHLDRRSREQSKFIADTFGSENYMNISGIRPFPGGCSAMTFIWFKQNMPEILDKTFMVGHLPSLIYKRMTGVFMTDFVNASMMGMYETSSQSGWSDILIREFGLRRDIFGEILDPGRIHGYLLKEMAEKIGVHEGIPVAVGTNDVAVAHLGAGNKTAGCIMNTTGSSEMVSILVDRPVVDPGYYLRNAALPGLWQIYVTTCGGFGVDWFYEQFCRDMTRDEFFAFENDAIREYLNLGDQGVSFTPYLTGDRQSLKKKTASWDGLTLAATRSQMLAALLASIQDVMISAIDAAGKVVDLKEPVKISGGMATAAYMEMKEQAYHGMSLEVVDDCPILGNVNLALHYL